MLELSIDGEERIKRTFTVWYDGLAQDLRYARSANRPKGRLREIDRGIRKLVHHATVLGFAELRDDKDKRTGIGMQMPRAD